MGTETASVAADYVKDIARIFRTYKDLGDKSFAQLEEKDLVWKVEPESNSIANVVMHVSGNFLSRWTDFLTTDGEKPWRNRDTEFEDAALGKEGILRRWDEGWKCLFDALAKIRPEDLEKTIMIRGEPHTLVQALDRSVTHCAYHVGQIVFIAKAARSTAWKSLSIPRGQSGHFNAQKLGR
jgi:hypothetical protein